MEPRYKHKIDAPPTSNNSKTRRRSRRRPPLSSPRTKPPSQDRLVVAFATASGIFFVLSISPFMFGNNLPSIETDTINWVHKHNDGMGGVLHNLAGNKTLLARHYFEGQQRQQLAEDNAKHQYVSMNHNKLPLSRGVSGLPVSKTPALVGAQHGSIQCREYNMNVDQLAYWNEPQGDLDVSFRSPFVSTESSEKRYVTFEPDRGGWNNIRMSLEIVIVFAAATGRTLVLPPDTPFYLLKKGKKSTQHHGFADFIDLKNKDLLNKLPMITMKEFLEKEGTTANRIPDDKMFKLPTGKDGEKLMRAAEQESPLTIIQCLYVAKSDRPCDTVYDFLISEAYVPELQANTECLIFDIDKQASTEDYTHSELFDLLPIDEQEKLQQFCGQRNPVFYGNELASSPIIHFHSGEKDHRLLNHFYTFIYFPDTKIEHTYKRFVRDFLHYTDTIWCAAGRVIQLLEDESKSFSSMHVRRGDFQYKNVKITADDWYKNTRGLFEKNEIVYIATDERDTSFFLPLAKHYKLRFLSNFIESAGLNELDPNIMGMVDTIIASRGRIFVGTWFSTFTGYINRMRGYYGMSGTTSFYSTPDRKLNTHKWQNHSKILTAREWPEAWIGIDGDTAVFEEQIPI